jgi:hypothetical protein
LTATYPGIEKQLMQPKGYSWNCPKEEPKSPHNRRVDLNKDGGCQYTLISTEELRKTYGAPALIGGSKHVKHSKRHHR